MELNDILDLFYKDMSQIQLYKNAMKELTKKEIEKLSNEKELLKKQNFPLEVPTSFQNMAFTNPISGKAVFYGKSEKTIDKKITSVFLHRNKQYCWLFAEAYELFENFIQNIYAFLGQKDINNWLLSDFGNETYDNLAEKPFNWYVEKANKKNNIPKSIINRLKKLYPDLDGKLKNNALSVNLDLIIVLIQDLRHNIVHNSGKVFNKDSFIDGILKNSGIYNNGNPNKENIDYINQFFGKDQYENTILFLEKSYDKISQPPYTNVFDTTINNLMGSVYIIYNEVIGSQSDKKI